MLSKNFSDLYRNRLQNSQKYFRNKNIIFWPMPACARSVHALLSRRFRDDYGQQRFSMCVEAFSLLSFVLEVYDDHYHHHHLPPFGLLFPDLLVVFRSNCLLSLCVNKCGDFLQLLELLLTFLVSFS